MVAEGEIVTEVSLLVEEPLKGWARPGEIFTFHAWGGSLDGTTVETVGEALGLGQDAVVRGLESLAGVPGRMQRIGDEPLVVVDYAHTPDALEKVLIALRPVAEERGGRLVVVFGAGGERDAAKRPLMGAAASRLADRVVVTSDNPRSEDPLAIIAAIRRGAGACERYPDGTIKIRENGSANGTDLVRFTYAEDGVLTSEQKFRHEKPQGTWTYYFPGTKTPRGRTSASSRRAPGHWHPYRS